MTDLIHCNWRKRWWVWDLLFDRYAWFRRRCGGHWEQWTIDFPVCSFSWFQLTQCSKGTGWRPCLGRGTPCCEETH